MTYWPSAGTVALVDLEAACELYGRDTLPYPLGRSRPVGSAWLVSRRVEPIEERLRKRDLRGVRTWVEALVGADLCVECRVQYPDDLAPAVRLHAVRAGDLGFVAVQGCDSDGVDTVDIYAVPPTELVDAVVDLAPLAGAGAHPRIAVAGRDDPPEYDDFGCLIPGRRESTVPVVADREVVATGTVQSRCRAAEHWGIEVQRPMLQWLQVRGDGDYLLGPEGFAEPLDAALLTMCVEGLIADLATVGERRGPN